MKETESDSTQPMGKIIPFRPRGGWQPPPEAEIEPPDRNTIGFLRGLLVVFCVCIMIAMAGLGGWFLHANNHPQHLLEVLEKRMQPDGIVLSEKAAGLLVFSGGPQSGVKGLPVRLSGQSIPPRFVATTQVFGQEATAFSNRELELALLIAIEKEWSADLLHGFARLTLAQSTDRQDILRAQKALALARKQALQNVDILTDYAAVSMVLGENAKAKQALEEADALLEDHESDFCPVIYNRALLERGNADRAVELMWLQTYLGIEGGSFWSQAMRERYEILETQ